MKRSIAVLVVLLGASVARAENEGMPAGGFVFETSVAAAFNLGFAEGGAAVLPRLFAGGRIADRLQLGVTFFLVNAGSSGDLTAFTFGPQLKFDIVKRSNNRVAFYGKIGLDIGDAVSSPQGAPATNEILIGLDLGLGVRFVPIRHFAIGLEGGTQTLFIGPSDLHITSIYGAIVGTFYLGS